MKEEITGEEVARDLIPAVEQQIESAETPFVKEEYERLLKEEFDPEETKMMIGLCLADEVEAMNIQERGFDLDRYQQMLKFLPSLPEE